MFRCKWWPNLYWLRTWPFLKLHLNSLFKKLFLHFLFKPVLLLADVDNNEGSASYPEEDASVSKRSQQGNCPC